MVSVQNGLFCGLCLVNAFDVLIANSTFANNEGSVYYTGNALIVYDNQHEGSFRVNIMEQILH